MSIANTPHQEARRRRTARLVLSLSCAVMIFDGYDVVVYGTVVPGLLQAQAWGMNEATAGAIGSYALVGMIVGALAVAAVGDIVGRRKMLLISVAWFSLAMGYTAMADSLLWFASGRILAGVGIGMVIPTAGALAAEMAPPGRRNLYGIIVFTGYPIGGALAGLLAILLLGPFGWQELFWLGALPLVTLLPLAWFTLPESPKWLLSRGRVDEAERLADRLGIPFAEVQTAAPRSKGGTFAPFRGKYLVPTALIALMSMCALLLTFALNTWLPTLMERNGIPKTQALSLLVLMNIGAIVGSLVASRFADKFGAKRVIAFTFALAAIAITVLAVTLPLPLLVIFVAFAGIGTIGSQVLILGFVANYYETSMRAAGVAWSGAFGRLGAIGGPLIGGFLLTFGFDSQTVFLTFAVAAVVGAVASLVVPTISSTHGVNRSIPAGLTKAGASHRD